MNLILLHITSITFILFFAIFFHTNITVLGTSTNIGFVNKNIFKEEEFPFLNSEFDLSM